MIAVPIVSETLDNALSQIETANNKADIIELRLDFISDVTESTLEELLEKCKKPVIVTFREKNFGATVEATERMFILQKAIELGADFIDLDFETDHDFVKETAKSKGGTKRILSYHNFNATPSLPDLLKKAESMLSLCQPDVLKLVTFANSESDNDTILGLIHALKKTDKKVIAFCMGPKGIRSRKECIKLGGFLTFASLGEGSESAEGQIPVDELRKELGK